MSIQRESSSKLLLFIAIWVMLSTESITSFAQWQKLIEPGNFYVGDIRFLEKENDILNGILIFSESGVQSAQVWYTRDGGANWILSASKLSSQYGPIAIKDDNVALVFPHSGSGDFVYRTFDGGISWTSLSLSGLFSGAFYSRNRDLFFANDWSAPTMQSYVTNDNGDTWSIRTSLSYPLFKAGFTSSNDSVFIEGGGNNSMGAAIFSRTFDGGMTWESCAQVEEAYQPLLIRNTGTCFLASEVTNNILRSDNFGSTWDTIYSFPNTFFLTGCIVGDLCHLYIQTNGDGTWESTDEGKSWHKVADFGGYRDTRFYFFNNVLFIGDAPNSQINKSGALWRYTLPPHNPKIFLTNSKLSAQPCKPIDTILTFSALFSCDGDKVMLDTIYSVASPNFTIMHNGFGKEIVSDSFRVHYDPTGDSFDTAEVHLRFRLKGNMFDTSVFIFGESVSPKDSLEFIPSLTRNNITSGEVTEYRLFPSKAVRDVNLTEISFDVTLDEDLLEMQAVTGVQGSVVSSSSTRLADGFVAHHITISGTDISLDPAVPVARFSLLTYITDTISTPIALSNVRLNSFDPDYERCTLSATSQDTTFTLALLCGDRTLTDFLRHGQSALEITSIRPNPARDEVTVEIVAEGVVTIEVYDAVGKLVQTSQGKAGVVVVPVSRLSSGSYVMRVASGGGVVSRGFVVER